MKINEFFIYKLPDNHPNAPGRFEADSEYGPSSRQGGTVVAGPFSDFAQARDTAAEKDLYAMANRVFDGDGTSDEIEKTEEAGLIVWEVGIDGYAPSPTQKYLELMDKFDPTPEGNDDRN